MLVLSKAEEAKPECRRNSENGGALVFSRRSVRREGERRTLMDLPPHFNPSCPQSDAKLAGTQPRSKYEKQGSHSKLGSVYTSGTGVIGSA